MQKNFAEISIINRREMFFFKNTIFVSSHMYPENPEGTQVIVGSMNMVYVSDIARNWTSNLFRPKCKPIPLGHSDERLHRKFCRQCREAKIPLVKPVRE